MFLSSLAEGAFTLVQLTGDDLRRTADLVEEYGDLPLATTDAAVLAIARRLHITEIATLDHRHFTVVQPRHLGVLELLP